MSGLIGKIKKIKYNNEYIYPITTTQAVYNEGEQLDQVIKKMQSVQGGSVKWEDVIEGEIFEVGEDAPAIIPVQEVSLIPATYACKIDDIFKLEVKVTPIDATDQTLVWSITPIGAVERNVDGTFTAKIEGETSITASATNNISAACKVQISKIDQTPIENIPVTKNLLLRVDGRRFNQEQWTDLSENNHHGTLIGCPKDGVNGFVNNALVIGDNKGHEQYVSFGHLIELESAQEVTIEIVAKLDNTSFVLLGIDDLVKYKNPLIGIRNNLTYGIYADNSQSGAGIIQIKNTDLSKVHTYTYSLSVIQNAFYIDGILKGSNTKGYIPPTKVTNEVIIMYPKSLPDTIIGKIYCVRIYTRRLSNEEINQNREYDSRTWGN